MRVRMANSDGWDLIIARRDRRAGDKSRQTTHEKISVNAARRGEAWRGARRITDAHVHWARTAYGKRDRSRARMRVE